MTESEYIATHPELSAFQASKNFRRREQSRLRVARLRERRGAAVGTSISLPPEVHEAAVRLLCVSRRGRGPTAQARAYLTGVMMAACAGQSAVAKEMADEFALVKSYLSKLDSPRSVTEANTI